MKKEIIHPKAFSSSFKPQYQALVYIWLQLNKNVYAHKLTQEKNKINSWHLSLLMIQFFF